MKGAFQQLEFAAYEVSLAVNGKHWRWLTIWLGKGPCVLLSYRIDRFLFLLLGNAYVLIRPLFFPLFLFLRIMSCNHEIDYRADIGRGLKLLHPTLGFVVSGETIAGSGLVLTGGNCIGQRAKTRGKIRFGDNVSMGANAVVLGPVNIGNGCVIGAGAVVVRDCADHSTVVGVPAKPL